MKRMLALAVAGSLASALLLSTTGDAQTTVPSIPRGSLLQISATTTPKRDRFRPYTFTTRGRISPPGRYCDPHVDPGPGAANCVPILCPPGSNDPSYCLRPGRSVICSGTVNVRYQKRTTTISSRNVVVNRDCTFQSRVTFRLRGALRSGTLRRRARFLGNPVLLPKSSSTQTVRAG